MTLHSEDKQRQNDNNSESSQNSKTSGRSKVSLSEKSMESSTTLKRSTACMDFLPVIENDKLVSNKNNEEKKENNEEKKQNNEQKKQNNEQKKQNNEQKKENNEQKKQNNEQKKENNEKDNSGKFTTAVENIRKKMIEEILAKKKQEEEERERFVKESAEKNAAEKAEIIKQAKRLILYRKPMCRRINQALVVSECYRELDAQVKFQETIKRMDQEEEERYVNLMKSDVAKYEEEQQQATKKRLENQRKYASGLREQIEENERNANEKKTEEFEAGKQDQININKYLQDIKEHEEQELLNKKQKLKQFFRDAIEEKKRFDLKLKQEEEFEDRAIEAYQISKTRINKMHKEIPLKRKQDFHLKARAIAEKHQMFMHSKEELENKIFEKATEEQEALYKEKERKRKDREAHMRKQLQDFQKETVAAKLEQFQKAKDLKVWEMMQRFKKMEYNNDAELKEQGAQWDKKMEYGNSLRKYISQNELERQQEQILEEKAGNVTEVMEKENQRVMDYANEVINESRNVRPLYPILKAVEVCKKEMGLVPLRKKQETVTATAPRRRQTRLRVCTKFVPEEQICYL